MIEPAPALVRPRVVGRDGQLRLLEDVIESLLSRGDKGIIILVGPPGSGKKTALRHVAARLGLKVGTVDRCRFVDMSESPSMDLESLYPSSGLTIAAACDSAMESGRTFGLARWGRDDLIEYLLARHPTVCSSVMTRIQDGELCEGLPRLWAIVLDHLAADQTLPNVRSALLRHVKDMKLPPDFETRLHRFGWKAITGDADADEILAGLLAKIDMSEHEPFFLMEPVQTLLACEYYVDQLRSPRGQSILRQRLPDDLLPAVADALRCDHEVIDQLQFLLTRKVDRVLHPASATLLVAIDPTWRPREIMREANLNEATLNHVRWPGIDLSGADLNNASLNDADLSNARLAGATFHSASLRRANLQRANLTGGVKLVYADATGAQFQNADLTGAIIQEAELDGANFDSAVLSYAVLNASLTGSSFRNANLVGTSFVGCRLEGADFTGANLYSANLESANLTSCCFDGARLERVSLVRAVLEDICWTGVVMKHANLHDACLTGSQLQGARLCWTDFTNARLGDIDWENADLRFAKFSGATFHMGSSRGGLVFSPFACEGSKTGFYTDELHEQHFKAPEEIRKANLRGADLRGAILGKADFYLVDLRNAKLDPQQTEYVRSCGAILNDRM
jgi:uncharacterized protein YjbI with pentapeptide repeats